MEIMLWTYRVLGLLLVISVLVPFIRSDHWTVRVFDYPRSQKLALVGFGLFIGARSRELFDTVDLALAIALLVCAGFLVWLVFPYTQLGSKMVASASPSPGERPLRLLVCNVLQTNTRYHRMASLVHHRDPDIILLLETDEGWRSGLKDALKNWQYRVEIPLANTYGLLLYSRLPIESHEVRYLIDREVPSIVADIRYRGRPIRLFGLHPTPPVPQENSESTERDAEVLMVGREAERCPHPVIVCGDLNDVAWSHTTRLFLRTSGLLDPRRGRGMFNTFHADYPFLRWPLDHLFVSPHFRLVDMRVERGVGSDHFPISMSVVLRGEDDAAALEATPADHDETAEKIAEGKESGDARP
jgi:endonuclease/exonuclease/phosphatase (EEP) superfamily protein YafD